MYGVTTLSSLLTISRCGRSGVTTATSSLMKVSQTFSKLKQINWDTNKYYLRQMQHRFTGWSKFPNVNKSNECKLPIHLQEPEYNCELCTCTVGAVHPVHNMQICISTFITTESLHFIMLQKVQMKCRMYLLSCIMQWSINILTISVIFICMEKY